MSYLQIEDKRIEISDESAEAMAKALEKEKKGLWKPKIREFYYCINTCGEVYNNYWVNYKIDDATYAIGNCYHTKEEAEQKIAGLKAIQSVKKYISQNFGVFEPNWKKCCYPIAYDFSNSIFYSQYCNYDIKVYSPFGYLKSEEDCKQLIEDKEAELRIIFNV